MGITICVFGLGEAGSLFAADLAASGINVTGFDPADVATPEGVKRFVHPSLAVREAEIVLAATSASDSKLAMLQSIDALRPDALYADLSTGSPELKNELAGVAGKQDFLFADVALMSMVPGNGLRTPSLASGSGAQHYAEVLNEVGGNVEPISGPPGTAAARKLLRSIALKGTAAVMIEAVQAGAAMGDLEWLWEHLAVEFGSADRSWMHRLVAGSKSHAVRRKHEMEAVASMLDDLGVPSSMTKATIESLERLIEGDLPVLPSPGIPTDLSSSVLRTDGRDDDLSASEG